MQGYVQLVYTYINLLDNVYFINPREDAGDLSREYVLRIPSVS